MHRRIYLSLLLFFAFMPISYGVIRTIDLASSSQVTGILPAARGGTGGTGGADAVPWSRITASQTASVNNGYGLDTITAAAGLKLTLPSSPAVGSSVHASQLGEQFTSIIFSPSGGKPINDTAAPCVIGVGQGGTGAEMRYVDATAGWVTRADTPPMPATGLWIASQGVTGATVSSWVDVVGAKDFIQATGGAQPAYSATGFGGLRPAITPDAGDRLAYTGPLFSPQAFWVAGVFRAHATTSGILIGEYESAGTDAKHWIFGNGTGAIFGLAIYDDDGSSILARPTVTAGTYYWAMGVWDGTINANAVTVYLATAGTTITTTVSSSAAGMSAPTWPVATPCGMFSGLTSAAGAFYWPASSPVLTLAYGLGVPTANQVSGIYRSMWGIGTGGM